ncbi:MAG: PHP domain-containing protein [Microscillaceae bacterium]|nr:PHP domain-containing protein [Microscillaceae bacterium]MDW8461091.1 PHP domain-containing protein [Cytophagales bacterium]
MIDTNTLLQKLRLYVTLLELHDENEFKIRTYQNAIFQAEKNNYALAEMPLAQIASLKGIGKSLLSKIEQLRLKGTFDDLEILLNQTPAGVLQMFKIQGLGKKKIQTLWKEYGYTSLEALYEACENGQIAQLKGFGEKMQENIKNALLYQRTNSAKIFWADAEPIAHEIKAYLQQKNISPRIEIAGNLRQVVEVLEKIELIMATDSFAQTHQALALCPELKKNTQHTGIFTWRGTWKDTPHKIEIHLAHKDSFESQWFMRSASWQHLTTKLHNGQTLRQIALQNPTLSEVEIYQKVDLPYILPLHRENCHEFRWISQQRYQPEKLLQLKDLKGILHVHSTYSDGADTLQAIAEATRKLGYDYLGITDHSKSAFYANGLEEKRIWEQHAEIDRLNAQFEDFYIFKGIEADILADGSLDYDYEILKSFDFVIASIHSGLKMNLEKATQRLIKAIENPYTTILGHPTGRIWLKREGYPIDYRKVIDACAANGVAIEVNASPYRLDLDWRWIDLAQEKSIKISINPDAHEIATLQDVTYGIIFAQKGGLLPENTLNAFSREKIAYFFQQKSNKSNKG